MDNVVKRLKEIKVTDTTRFILPALYTKERKDNFFVNKYFENCFLGDVDHEELGTNLFILYSYQPSLAYIKFEKALELIPEYETDYDLSDLDQVMFVFNLPKEFQENLKHFKEGNIHLFNDEYKQQILQFWGLDGDKQNAIYRQLYPSDAIPTEQTFKDSENHLFDIKDYLEQ